MVMVREILEAKQQAAPMQPSIVQRQARVNNVVRQIAASDQARPPTEAEVVSAHMQYAAIKKQNDALHARRLQQQAIQAAQKSAPKAPKVGGRQLR